MNSKFLFASALLVAAAISAGCESTVQTTSGQRYLERYPHPSSLDSPLGTTDLDQRVAAVAAVEPTLRFPARVGLARIEHGRLASLPADEGKLWSDLRDKFGPEFGEFIPLSPIVAEMVAPSSTGSKPGWQRPKSLLQDAIARIRLGAARQHLDAVLIYEVVYDREITGTTSTILDITGVGAFMGTRHSHAQGYATALLVDVRNGYPYGTAMAVANDNSRTALLGSEERLRKQRIAVVNDAVSSLTPEVEHMFRRLQTELAAIDARPAVAVAQAPGATAASTVDESTVETRANGGLWNGNR